jgi:catalase
MVTILAQIDTVLAERVARGLGLTVSAPVKPLNQSVPADGDPAKFQPRDGRKKLQPSPELSIVLSNPGNSVQTRKVAILAADGCDDADLSTVIQALTAAKAQAKIVAPHLGYIQTAGRNSVKVHFSLLTASSVLFDAVYLPGGQQSVAALRVDPAAAEFVSEAYKHAKAIAAAGAGVELLRAANVMNGSKRMKDEAIVIGANGASAKMAAEFIAAIAKHRNWEREKMLRPDLRTEPAMRTP